ncbi:MAG: alpha/beta hydrolase-fold protein [Chthoniobacteraceae bacterium]
MFRPLLLAGCSLLVSCSRATQPEALVIESRVLADNPLGDRTQRRVAIFSPESAGREKALPMVVYLPGWGSSSENFLAPGGDVGFERLVAQLAKDGLPLRIAVVDGRSRYGGSQFVNSAATGRYADFVADEIVGALAKDHPWPPGRCWIAGHSSGGYGALRLAMDRPEIFSAAIALSPDSDFEVTHKPLVQQPAVQRLTPAELAAAMAPRGRQQLPGGLAELVLGLCANYTPSGPGRFEWLYDAEGRWRADVWQRWIDADPLTIVRRKTDAFSPKQAVYLDGAQFDEFGANIGAKKIFEAMRERPSPVIFYEAPGHHGDHMVERLERGLRWVFEKTGR